MECSDERSQLKAPWTYRKLGYKKIIEENIKLTTLKQASNLYIGNAVRGLLKAQVKTQ